MPIDLEEHRRRLDDDGYTVVERLVDDDLVDALLADVGRLERELGVRPGDNRFEGARTVRTYNLLARGEIWQQVPVHPVVLGLVEHVIGPECLVSSLASISIHPGETAQVLHADDQAFALAKPHSPVVCNSMWALTDFTEANGATRLIPGSHLRECSPEYGRHYDSIPAEMPRGSVLVWHGSLWHGGGANTTDGRRYGIAMNYCAGWVRQQENQQLGLPLDTVRRFEPRLQQLCGFDTYRGLIGHIDRQTPAERLLDAEPAGMLWDAT